jgi:hypothetical protein
MVGAVGKALLVAAVLLVAVACDQPTGAPTADNPTTADSAQPSAAATSPSPTPTTAQPQIQLVFVNAPLTVAHGRNATLKAKTSPNTSCSIEVDYKSGPSSAAGLDTKNSDGAGNVSWTWKVGTNTTHGSWPIFVTCGDASAETHITVT